MTPVSPISPKARSGKAHYQKGKEVVKHTNGGKPKISMAEDLLSFGTERFATILADPPWQFQNRTGKMAPEHQRLRRYQTLSLQEIMELPVAQMAQPNSHLYLWVPNALIKEGLEVMRRWGYEYKTNIVWFKVRQDGGPDGRGVGFYFRNVTEMVLFGVRGRMRTLQPGRTQTNIVVSRKREHSRKPDELHEIIEACSPGPYLELFARSPRPAWTVWGNESDGKVLETLKSAVGYQWDRRRTIPQLQRRLAL